TRARGGCRRWLAPPLQRRAGARLSGAVAAGRPPAVPAAAGFRHRAAVALAAGAGAAGAGPVAPGHDPRAGRTLRAALRTREPAGAAHAADDRRCRGIARRAAPARSVRGPRLGTAA